MKRTALLLLLAVAWGAGQPAWSATGLAFLKNGVDARAVLLGQAVSSVVADASAVYWNPAGLARLNRPQLLLSHVESFAALRQEYAAVTQPVGRATAALAFNGMWTDDMDGYDRYANPTGKVGWAAYEAAVALGREISPGLALGASLSYLRESIGQYGASGWAAGAGVQWAPWSARGVCLGLNVRNLGPSMQFIAEDVRLPLTVQGGASWSFHPSGSASSVLVAGELRHVRDEGTAMLWGAEYGYQDMLSLGLGYRTSHDTRDLSVGIGAHPGRWSLYWAYVPIAEELGDEHRFSLRVNL
ncbi:MAG: PorV/PorQ family protein [Candidatus Eisenbacteria bacterium]